MLLPGSGIIIDYPPPHGFSIELLFRFLPGSSLVGIAEAVGVLQAVPCSRPCSRLAVAAPGRAPGRAPGLPWPLPRQCFSVVLPMFGDKGKDSGLMLSVLACWRAIQGMQWGRR